MFTAFNYLAALALVAVIGYAIISFVVTGTTEVAHSISSDFSSALADAADPRK